MNPRPLRVLFVSGRVLPELSGVGARAAALLEALQGPFEVDALCPRPPESAHILRFHGARLMRVPVGTGDALSRRQAFERAVKRQVESDDYDVVHVSDPLCAALLCELKAERRYRLVVDACVFPSVELPYTDPAQDGDRRFMADLKKAERLALIGADAVLVGSSRTREFVVAQGLGRSRVHVFPPMVGLAPYAAAPLPPPDRTPMCIGYLGSGASWQGLSTLLFALRQLQRRPGCEGTRLRVAGLRTSAQQAELTEQIAQAGLGGAVELQEPVSVEELPAWLGAIDVGVAPLEKGERNLEQGGLLQKVADYAAAGRPMVCSDLPWVRSLVDERQAAFHPPGDEDALAAALEALALAPARRVEMGRAARALAQERFDRETSAEPYALLMQAHGLRARMDRETAEAEDDGSAEVITSVGEKGPEATPSGLAMPEQPPAPAAPEPPDLPWSLPLGRPAESTQPLGDAFIVSVEPLVPPGPLAAETTDEESTGAPTGPLETLSPEEAPPGPLEGDEPVTRRITDPEFPAPLLPPAEIPAALPRPPSLMRPSLRVSPCLAEGSAPYLEALVLGFAPLGHLESQRPEEVRPH